MKRLLLAGLAVAATLASCEKTSMVDTALTTNQSIKFAPYAGAATRGTAINSTDNLKAYESGSFKVSALIEVAGTDEKYFDFREVKWVDPNWVNQTEMYWPNANSTLFFGAIFPTSAMDASGPLTNQTLATAGLSFDYNVDETVAHQKDLMVAIADYDYTFPTGTDAETDTENAKANLHFKHALTQIAFTATKDADINVDVTSVSICNVVNNGKFASAANTDANGTITEDKDEDHATSLGDAVWTPATGVAGNTGGHLSHYAATMEGTTPITVATSTTQISSTGATDVMMLLPQELTAWKPTGTNGGTESYLAINCKITHSDGSDDAPIQNGIVYIPFDTETIPYTGSDAGKKGWLPGYKITYNLHFGGGYTDPTTPTTPTDPGETPDPDVVIPTLRPITYAVSVDAWIPVGGGSVAM